MLDGFSEITRVFLITGMFTVIGLIAGACIVRYHNSKLIRGGKQRRM
ncbi:hypothetical protein [Desulfobaculum bizertense]|uniref:Uncharacterized protein n=1 Tax=Desulfobaculum bizertense DSM 18034 TaxID=1121442 RepID=A0A1T4VW49_9BACT|nr:hypothetical protein [Desulfobaculum bizertense]UIJ36775.1 hypothetical protein LWC08_08480 [Desulfobaculum bizertense]SKA69222.1 hypothetical protein SAMN02745702_01074 [Desulfobaculum bizertense DSM 18034]